MTKDERVYVENYVIAQLNTAFNRVLATVGGKLNTVRRLCKEILEKEFSEISERGREQVVDNVIQKATSCAYPQEELPLTSCTLDYNEVLFLADTTAKDIEKTVRSLSTITDVMKECGDERWEALRGALTVFEELLLTKGGAKRIKNRNADKRR